MKPIDFRNETFAEFRERFNSIRESVYRAWVSHGPGTTREVAERCHIDLLTFRPRSTELYQMGFIRVQPGQSHLRNGEGVYEAVPEHEVVAWYEKQREAHRSGQQQLL
jgi:hypothetical protein